jgi:uncharacterized glyoxalase superfamily protein PhnB
MKTTPKLTPLLVVRDAARAITFYVQGLGAKEIAHTVVAFVLESWDKKRAVRV